MKRLLVALAALLAVAQPCFAAGFVSLADSTQNSPITAANPLPVQDQHTTAAPMPVNQAIGTAIQGASGNVANSSAVATLAGTSGKTTYITGFQCTGTGATSVKVASVTVSDGTWTMTFTYLFVAGVTTLNAPLIVTFPVPVPASAANTSIAVTLPSSGSGGTNAACNAQGYQL